MEAVVLIIVIAAIIFSYAFSVVVFVTLLHAVILRSLLEF